MPISASVGTFSGINYQELITGLLAVEQQRLDTLEERKSDYETQISAYGELSSSLGELQSAVEDLQSSATTAYSATSSDEDVFTASASTKAADGQYQINVSQIAKNHQIYSSAYSSESATFTQGSLIIAAGGESTSVTIDSSNNTLAGVRDAINQSDANVTATVLHDIDGYRLVLSSKTTGSDNAISGVGVTGESGSGESSLTSFNFDPEFGSGNMTESQAGQDAVFTVNGLTVTSAENTVTDVITGVTLNIRSTSTTDETLSIESDADNITDKVDAFVTAYNNSITKLNELSNRETGGTLSSDSSLSIIKRRLRNITFNTYNDRLLLNYGISHDSYGFLQSNSSDISSAVTNDMDTLIATLDTFSQSFDSTLDDILDSMIPTRESNLSTRARDVEDDIFDEQYKLERLEESLVKKFAALESTIAELQSSGDALNNSLGSLPKPGGQ